VVDPEGRLVGVVSVTDITETLAEEAEPDGDRPGPRFFLDEWEDGLALVDVEDLRFEEEIQVREIMTPEVHTVPEETPVSEIAEMMMRTHVHRLLVTREHKVVGILSTSDLLGLLVDEKE
jgi:CBS domain-containing protein